MTIMTKMEDNNIVAGLERTHSEMDPCQYVREIYQNSIEAGATDIRFTIDKLAKKSLGVSRGVGIDNGPGIPKNKIKDLINKKNSSSKKTGNHDENFGVGLKVAALPRNQYGLIVICRTEQKPKGFMIWLAYGLDANNNKSAGLKSLISDEQVQSWIDGYSSEPIGQDLIDFEDIEKEYDSFTIDGIDWMSWWDVNSTNETGTAIVLCGNSKEENTFEHLIYKGRKFLLSRFLKFKARPKFLEKDTNSDGKRIYKHMSLHDPIDVLKNYSIDSGTLIYKSWKLHYFLKGDDPKITMPLSMNGALIHQKFKEVILYKNELYGDFASIKGQALASIRNSWGIFYKSVGKRVTLIVEPPIYTKQYKRGVYPNEARSKLSWKSYNEEAPTQTLPLDDLKKHFIDNMPKSIRDLINEAIEGESADKIESQSAKQYQKYLSIPKDKRQIKKGIGLLIKDRDGLSLGGDTTEDLFHRLQNNGVRPEPGPTPPNPNPKPKKLSAEELARKEQKRKAREEAEKKRQEPPQVIWIDQGHEQAEEWFFRNGFWQAANYEKPSLGSSSNVLRLNKNHEFVWFYFNMAEEWLKERNHKMTKEQILEIFVRLYWIEVGPGVIQHMKGIPSIYKDKDGFAPERLTAAFCGRLLEFRRELHLIWKKKQKRDS